jgi:DNA-binding beta-propeller fold protein YncE
VWVRSIAAAFSLLLLLPAAAGGGAVGGQPVALVTAERQNELIAVALPQGRVAGRVELPADPENVIAEPGAATVVVSARGAAVTLLSPLSLKVLKVIRGFTKPHLAAYSPDRAYAYVSDDGSGRLVAIDLIDRRIVARVSVGLGAHHLAVSPDGSRVWVALGEHAEAVAIVDTSNPQRPRLAGFFVPHFSIHDLAFSPDGRRVWLTSDDETGVHVVNARTRRLLFTVPAGRPPQHVAFDQRHAFVTSGYGSRIELVDPRRGTVLRSAREPYGSFNLATSGGLVATSSLFAGSVSELTGELEPLRTVKVAGAARDVALTVWP